MIDAIIKYNKGKYEIRIDRNLDQWKDFLASLERFYAFKPSQLPNVRLIYKDQVYQTKPSDITLSRETPAYRINRLEPINLIDDLKQFYGTTDDINECGFILPDGSMLDFSGRHLMCGFAKCLQFDGRRALNHDNVFGINNDGLMITDKYRDLFWSNLSIPLSIMEHSSAVRVGVGLRDIDSFIHVSGRLTEQQIETIDNCIHGKLLIVDCTTRYDIPVFDQKIVVSKQTLFDINKQIEH